MCASKIKLQAPESLIMIVINFIVYSAKSCKYLHCIQNDKLLPNALPKILYVLINLFLKSSKAGASSDRLRDNKFHKAVCSLSEGAIIWPLEWTEEVVSEAGLIENRYVMKGWVRLFNGVKAN